MAKFTPGPWRLHEGFLVDVESEQGDIITTTLCAGDSRAIPADATKVPHTEAKANARLIAAAPEMYEWLKFYAEGAENDVQLTNKLQSLLKRIDHAD